MAGHFTNGKGNDLAKPSKSEINNVYEFVIFVCMKTKRTNIVINEELIKDIRRFSELKTKREIIERALEDHLNYLKRQKLRSLRGKINWEGDLMKMREGRL